VEEEDITVSSEAKETQSLKKVVEFFKRLSQFINIIIIKHKIIKKN